MRYNTKAIVTIPAWAEAMHEGSMGQKDSVDTAAAAYAYVPLVYRAVRLRADSLANTPIHITRKGGEEDVDWPFPDVDLKDLIWKSEASLCLMGANFIEKLLRRRSKQTGGLQWVNPTTMKVKYVAREDGTKFLQFQQGDHGATWTLDDMMYMREFSLRDDVGMGDSAAKVSLNDAALIRYMSRFAARFFESGAMPITVLQIEGLVDKDEKDRIEGFFKKAATRIRNAFNVLALARGIEPKIISQPLKDLVMPELNAQARHAVSLAFGIPQTMLEDAANYATSAEHRLSFWQDTVKPRGIWLAEQFNRQLLHGLKLEMSFGFDELDVFQEDENDRGATLGVLVSAIDANPEIASWAMGVLGYDLTEEQQADLTAIIKKRDEAADEARQAAAQTQTASPTQPGRANETVAAPRAKAIWADDLVRWQRKALRVLNETGSAVCPFDSPNMPSDVRTAIESALPDCKSVEDVRAAFSKQNDMTFVPAVGYKSDMSETIVLADAINALARADVDRSNTSMILELLQASKSSAPKQEEMQITINNPANIDMAGKETVEAVKTLAEQMARLQETVTASAATPPNVVVNVPQQPPAQIINQMPEQPPAQVAVYVPEQPAPIVNNSIDVQPAPVDIRIPKPKRERQKVKRNKDGLIESTDTQIEYEE